MIQAFDHLNTYRYNIFNFLKQNGVDVVKPLYAGSICFYYYNGKKYQIHLHVKARTSVVATHHRFVITKGGDYYLFALGSQAALLHCNQIKWPTVGKGRNVVVIITPKDLMLHKLEEKLHLLKENDTKKEENVQFKTRDEARIEAFDYAQELLDEGFTVKMKRTNFTYYVLAQYSEEHSRKFEYNIVKAGNEIPLSESSSIK